MIQLAPRTKIRYDCNECGGVGSAPTHKPTCSRSAFKLARLRLLDLQARVIRAYPELTKDAAVLDRDQCVALLLDA